MRVYTWAEILEALDTKCKICGVATGEATPDLGSEPFAVGHSTPKGSGHIVVSFCVNCNVALLNAKYDPTLLRKMADFLDQENQPIFETT